MKYRQLGTSGIAVSLIGLGCNNFGARMTTEEARPIVHAALDLGITLIDTADSYGSGGSEEALGEILGARRDDIVLTSKCGLTLEDSPRRLVAVDHAYIMQAVEASLRRLKTDRIDLYQLHALHRDARLDEILRALDDLVTQGKVRAIGACNLTGWQTVDADWLARHLGTARLINREAEAELLPALAAKGIGLLPFYPLAAGTLTGKYRRGAAMPADTRLNKMPHLADRYLTDANMEIIEALCGFAEARGRTLLELSFAWLASHAVIPSIIAGASRPEQVAANAAAIDWELTDEDVAEIDRLSATAKGGRYNSLFRG
jgi:aryl-alcohol dehydrogenase-like predicted oxidoreductase